jgi:hypothetical protein
LKSKTLVIGSREDSSVIGIMGAKPPLSGRLLESGETSRGDELFNGFSDRSRGQRTGYVDTESSCVAGNTSVISSSVTCFNTNATGGPMCIDSSENQNSFPVK